MIKGTLKRPDASVSYYQGITYKSLGRKAEAVAEFETCIKMSRNASLTEEAEREIEELRGNCGHKHDL